MAGIPTERVNNYISGLNATLSLAADNLRRFPPMHRPALLEAAGKFKAFAALPIDRVSAGLQLGFISEKLNRASRDNDQEAMINATLELAVACGTFISVPAAVLNFALCLMLGDDWIQRLLLKPWLELKREIDRNVGAGFSALAQPWSYRSSLTSTVLFYPGTLKLRGGKTYDRGTRTMRRPDPYICVWPFQKTFAGVRANAVMTNVKWNVQETRREGCSFYLTTGFRPQCLVLGPSPRKVTVSVYDKDTFSRDDLLGTATYLGPFKLGRENTTMRRVLRDGDVLSFDMRFVWRAPIEG